jgi:hypothetical protein
MADLETYMKQLRDEIDSLSNEHHVKSQELTEHLRGLSVKLSAKKTILDILRSIKDNPEVLALIQLFFARVEASLSSEATPPVETARTVEEVKLTPKALPNIPVPSRQASPLSPTSSGIRVIFK